MRTLQPVFLGVLLGLGSAPAAPVPPPTLVGKVIFVKEHGLALVDNPKSPEPRQVDRLDFMAFRVLDEKDGWIKVRNKGSEGWIARADVVPENEAEAFFTRKIKDRPDDVNAYYARSAYRLHKGDRDGALADLTE